MPVTATLACRNAGQVLVARAEAMKGLIASDKLRHHHLHLARLDGAQRDKFNDKINFNMKTPSGSSMGSQSLF